jgi:8-oxo-dGTP pyrophosphatase MutT (NUDIX family)
MPVIVQACPGGVARPAHACVRPMTARIGKAFAYITRAGELLVFEHVGAPEAGIQVPAGTIDPGETAAEAALREAVEETGWSAYRKPRLLGTAEFDASPYGKNEVHERWFFHLEVEGDPPRRWRHFERHASGQPGAAIELELFWTALDGAESLLIAEHGALLPRLRERMRIAAGAGQR